MIYIGEDVTGIELIRSVRVKTTAASTQYLLFILTFKIKYQLKYWRQYRL